MNFLNSFLDAFIAYVDKLWLAVVLGFVISGYVNSFISTDLVRKYLGKKGLRPLLLSSLIGVLLPVCCFGSLPIAITMKKKGARLGPTLAFLVTAPATSISALIVCWRLLGIDFTVYIFFAAVLMGLILGFVADYSRLKLLFDEQSQQENICENRQSKKTSLSFLKRSRQAFTYALITLPREIGIELILGIVLASLILVFDPIKDFIFQYLSGVAGYAASLLFGLATYVCSTASVPLAHALDEAGLGQGPVMVYLLAGPITSYGMIFVIRKKFGLKVLFTYLLTICLSALMLGFIFEAWKSL